MRLYTRDTADWMALSWDAQALLSQLLRKVDRAGAIALGRHGKKAVAIVLGQVALWERIAPALEELLVDGCVCVSGEHLFIPNFLEAQEAVSSDAQRKRDQREREQARLLAASISVTQRDADVTNRDQKSRDVTDGHAESRAVTPCLAVPSRAVPNPPSDKSPIADEAGASPPMDGVRAVGALDLPAIAAAAEPGRRAEDAPAPKAKKEKPPKATDPRHAPLIARLTATYQELRGAKYGFSSLDAKLVQKLIPWGTDDEIDARWRRGLQGAFKERCDSLRDLTNRWNALTGATGMAPRVVNLRKAPVAAEDIDRKHFAETGREHGF